MRKLTGIEIILTLIGIIFITTANGRELDPALSSCVDEFKRFATPDRANETWLGHSKFNLEMHKAAENCDVVVYYDSAMNESLAQYHLYLVNLVWRHAINVYGNDLGGHHKLYAFIHGQYLGTPNGFKTVFDHEAAYGNVIDIFSNYRPKPGTETNLILNGDVRAIAKEIAKIVEYSSKRVYGSPTRNLWTGEMWTDAFTFDFFRNWARLNDLEYYGLWSIYNVKTDISPRPNTYWFRDWFGPIYTYSEAGYGPGAGSPILNKYFTILADNFPKTKKYGEFPTIIYQYQDRNLTLGEYVHFMSGALGVNLKNVASRAFGWDEAIEAEFEQAKIEFPCVRYDDRPLP